MLTFHETIPLSLYIHLPWCVKKCPYCDFNSHVADKGGLPEKTYIDALVTDLEMELPSIWGRSINTVFIGGGTPSLLSASALADLFSALSARLKLYPDIEITLEANPGTAEAEKFEDYFNNGINRLSIGAQSFNDKKLESLGRIHNSYEALNAIELARQAGFENFNIDIMFGLPHQSIDEALEDLQTAIDQSPTHISWYQLTIELNTIYYSRPPPLPDEDRIWQMQQQGQLLLKENGYEQYEVSAYAKKTYCCSHNLNYWQFGDYLGLGAGAHGKITDISKGEILRASRVRLPESYLNKVGSDEVYAEQHKLKRSDISFEFMLNALRLTEGFDTDLFFKHTGMPLSIINKNLAQAEQQGLIQWQKNHIKPSEKGQRYLNDLLQLFMKD